MAPERVAHAPARAPSGRSARNRPDASGPRLAPPQALVTAETENRLLVVDLSSGHVARRVGLPPDPQDIATAGDGGPVIVVSARSGRVSVLARATLRPLRTFGGFDHPHIVAVAPSGRYAYVTDDSRGTLTVIRLRDPTITSTVSVGAQAHHVSFSPDGRRAWVALGESAPLISILDTSRADRPRVIGHLRPGFIAHDLSFSPDGQRVWITSDADSLVRVFDAANPRLLFTVAGGAPPQHLAFDGAHVYITSGYGRMIEEVSSAGGRQIRRATAPYGSFELSAADGYVAASSLLEGTVAVYTPGLRLLRVVKLAPATREVAISRP